MSYDFFTEDLLASGITNTNMAQYDITDKNIVLGNDKAGEVMCIYSRTKCYH